MMKRTVAWKLEELDRILNDPAAPLEAHRVWSLLDDVASSGLAEDAIHQTAGHIASGAFPA